MLDLLVYSSLSKSCQRSQVLQGDAQEEEALGASTLPRS